jgi:hypothetical protein
VSEFFESPPPTPKQEVYRQPPWFGAPRGTIPGIVAVELVLARTDRFAVCISRLGAYPTGFEFDLLALAAPGGADGDELDPMQFGHGRHRARVDQRLAPDEFLRLGVQFADGGKATNLPGARQYGPGQPDGPVLHGGGGGGGDNHWHQIEWVWPLPPPGPLAFVCEWPAAGIPVTRKEIDAQLILEAADRAKVIFSDQHLPDRSQTSVSVTQIGP